jgi:hypothetical protein
MEFTRKRSEAINHDRLGKVRLVARTAPERTQTVARPVASTYHTPVSQLTEGTGK